MVQQQQVITSGPIPTSAELRGYESTLAGAADRILAMAEKESEDRRAHTKRLVSAQVFQLFAGPIFGFVITGGALLAGFLLAYQGKDVASLGPFLIALATLVGSIASLFRKPQ